MKTKKITYLLLTVMTLMAQMTLAEPINRECEITLDPEKRDCTNDPFMISWEMDFMNFSYAWDKSYGTARVGIIDKPIEIEMIGLNEFGKLRMHDSGRYGCYQPGLEEHDENWEGQCQFYYSDRYRNFPAIEYSSSQKSHGDMIFSLFGSIANNSTGMSSVCRECSLAFYAWQDVCVGADDCDISPYNDFKPPSAQTNYPESSQYWLKALSTTSNALQNSTLAGNQIINLSGFFAEEFYPNCQEQLQRGFQQPICNSIALSKEFDIAFIASNGNSNTFLPNWPANENDRVIGVGGTDRNALTWDRFRDDGACPTDNNGNIYWNECGSQLNFGSPIMAPAKDVMVYHHNGSYSHFYGCSEFSAQYPGYQTCSGTSFAAPIISGIVSIIRSLNPLISFDEIKNLLENSRVYTDSTTGFSYSIPNIMPIMTKEVLGNFNGVKVANRLKPMFRLNTRFSQNGTMKNNYLSTSIPQVGASAMLGYYLADVNEGSGLLQRSHLYTVDASEPLAIGYPKFREPDMEIKTDNARAPFYIFGGHENPFTGEDDMIPLHHYALKTNDSVYPECYDLADHAYGPNKLSAFTIDPYVRCGRDDTRYVWEGIEGYLLPSCPQGQTCYETDNNPESPQCLMLRYSSIDDSYALVMESELQTAKFASYTVAANHLIGNSTECMGYVYPNVDTDEDFIIDGMELVLGTDPDDNDTDNDGVLDGIEYPPASPIVSNPLNSNSN